MNFLSRIGGQPAPSSTCRLAVRDSSNVCMDFCRKPPCAGQVYVYPSNPTDIVLLNKEHYAPNDPLHTPTLFTPSLSTSSFMSPTESLSSPTGSSKAGEAKPTSWSVQIGTKLANLWALSKNSAMVISKQDVGPGLDAANDSLPDWRYWENREERWLGFTPDDAIEIERYWKYFVGNEHLGEGAKRIAKLDVGRRRTVIHFEDMMVQFGGGTMRPIVRRHLPEDWLSNAIFLSAFSTLVGDRIDELGGKVESLFDINRNEDLRHMELSVPLHSAFPSVDIVARGRVFKPPIKWKRFAANAHGKVSDAPEWYKKRDPGAWGVAYIGLKRDRLPQVLFTTFVGRAANPRETEADILATPVLAVAEEDAGTEWWDGHAFQMLLELRVRPSEMQGETASNPYWLIKSARDVRTSAVLMRGV